MQNSSIRVILALVLAGGLGASLGRAAGPAGAALGPAAAPAPAGGQDFQDVPTSSPFYSYVHNLFVDGAVGGYACQPGGPVDPCVPPLNLPYFHPGSTVTRGQNAKFTDNGRRLLSGFHSGSAPNYGLLSVTNLDRSSPFNAAIYGQGAMGVLGESYSTGMAGGAGGYFYNNGGGTGRQVGAYGATTTGWGLEGVSFGGNPQQGSAGVTGESTATGGVGAVFTATNGSTSVGLSAVGATAAVLAVGGVQVSPADDGLDVGGAGGGSYGIDAELPIGDTNYSFFGQAHIRGSNIAGDDYESDVVYDGAAPLALGSVVALDPANAMGGPLGVVPVGAAGPDAAMGVISYRLTTVVVNTTAKTVIDAGATAVQPGDRAYVTILGRVTMPLPAGAAVGARLALGADGAVGVAAGGGASFGRVASRPDGSGRGYVLVNFR